MKPKVDHFNIDHRHVGNNADTVVTEREAFTASQHLSRGTMCVAKGKVIAFHDIGPTSKSDYKKTSQMHWFPQR